LDNEKTTIAMDGDLAGLAARRLRVPGLGSPGGRTDYFTRSFQGIARPASGRPHVVLLDVRTPKEFEDGHIQGALLLDYYSSDYVERLKALDRKKPI
jgi:hypothetical protein